MIEITQPYWEVAYENEEGSKEYGVCCFSPVFYVYRLNKVRFKGKSVARLIDVPNQPPEKQLNFKIRSKRKKHDPFHRRMIMLLLLLFAMLFYIL